MRAFSLSILGKSPKLFTCVCVCVCDPQDWQPSREQGSLVGLAAGSNILLIATSNNIVIRWNVITDECEELIVCKPNADRIHKVFLDPLGLHALVTMASGQNYYIHAKKTRVTQLAKVKNLVIESVAWSAGNPETSTRPILLGTNKGLLYECLIEEKDKYYKRLYDLNEGETHAVLPISTITPHYYSFKNFRSSHLLPVTFFLPSFLPSLSLLPCFFHRHSSV